MAVKLTAYAGLLIAAAAPHAASAQAPPPRLGVPARAAPAQPQDQPTAVTPQAVAPASPTGSAPAAPAGAPVTQVTGASTGVTALPAATPPATSSSAQAAMATNRSYTAGKFYLELGTAGTYVRSVKGGDATAEVVIENKLATGGLVPKHLAGVKYTDIEAEVAPTDFQDLIGDFLQGKYTRADGRLVGLDFNYKAQSELGFSHAMLTGVDFPALDGGDKDSGYLTIHLTPESTRDEPPGSAPTKLGVGSRQPQWLKRNFSLSIPGLETRRVTRIEPLSITLKLADNAVGEVRDYQRTPAQLGWGLLTVSFSAADAPSWIAWRDDFIIKGNNSNAAEKSLVLTLLSSDLKPLLTLNGSGVGIAGLRRLPSTGDAIVKYQADLYVEQWSITKGSSKGN